MTPTAHTRPRIALIHVTVVALDPIRQSFEALWPEAELANILDDSLSVDRARTAEFTPGIRRRVQDLADYAHGLGVRAILFTCSAFGPLIEEAARRLPVPVLKPNEAMFEEALACGERIGMVATFGPSIATMQQEFAEEAARLRPAARLTCGLTEAAMAALRGGDAATHNALVAESAATLGEVDAIMLAQFSTARALQAVGARTPLPVLSSPDAAVRKLRRLVQGA